MKTEDHRLLIFVSSVPHTVEMELNKCLPNARMMTSFSYKPRLQIIFSGCLYFYFSLF